MNKDIKNLNKTQLQELVCSLGGKKFHANYIFSYIHEQLGDDISQISSLSKQLRQRLIDDGWFISRLKTIEKFKDPDGTVKYLFEVTTGQRFETVLLRDNGRKTLCISCQAGCKMNCAFCATAKIKFSRHLTAGEIVNQVYEVIKDQGPLNNIVFMGMGEPFDNYDEVLKAAYFLNSPKGQNIGARHLTISTCGIPEKIEQLANEDIQVRLAVSIHAGSDETRTKIMPVNKKWPLKELTHSIKVYQKITKRRITFEYCMIKNVNDTDQECAALIKTIRGIKCNINLIEYNPHPGSKLEPSSKETIKHFQQMLTDAGFEAHVRYKRGQKIKAACGQLGADWLTKKTAQ